MITIPQGVTLLSNTYLAPLMLEMAARTCTNSCHQIDECNEYKQQEFVKRVIMARKHYSVLEHVILTFRIVTSRAIANQIVRHRMAAYCQESMRYVKLAGKGGGVPIIKPYKFDEWSEDAQLTWKTTVNIATTGYEELLAHGIKPEDARGVLPLDTATVLVATWNLRELLHILYHPVSGRLTNKHAQPQTRELFQLLEDELKEHSPFVYELCQIYQKNENPT